MQIRLVRIEANKKNRYITKLETLKCILMPR